LEDRLKIPVVPVFWLASEDHDAQEINHLWHGGQRFSHTVQPAQHAVGSLPASLALPALEGLRQAAKGWHEQEICDRWLQIYRTSHTLAEAVRALVFSYFDPQELVVLDPNKEKTIRAATQQSKIDYNVFEGHKVKGLPRFTLTRGQVAVQDGVVQTQEGHGQFVARAPRPAVNRALSAWKDLTAPRPVQRSGVPATGV
jgi:hypothetical protein